MKALKFFLRLILYAAFAFVLLVLLTNFTSLWEDEALLISLFFTFLLMLAVFFTRLRRRRKAKRADAPAQAEPKPRRPRRPVNKKRLALALTLTALVLGGSFWALLGFPGLSLLDRRYPADPQEVRDNLPDDLDPRRREVVEYALSLVGQVDYFWGGKSLTLGRDPKWGSTTLVTSPGSESTGSYRPYGMDCSGFVDWVFYNASGGSYVLGQGGGTYTQHDNCRDISWDEVQPGDLVFYPRDSHVGIVGARDSRGRLLIINCASGKYSNVVILGQDGFTSAARPNYYGY